MMTWPRPVMVIVIVSGISVLAAVGCTTPRAETPPPPATQATTDVAVSPPDPAVAQADALVQDMQQREAAYQATAKAEARAEAIRRQTIPRVVVVDEPAPSRPMLEPPRLSSASLPLPPSAQDAMYARARSILAPDLDRIAGALADVKQAAAQTAPELQGCAGTTQSVTTGVIADPYSLDYLTTSSVTETANATTPRCRAARARLTAIRQQLDQLCEELARMESAGSRMGIWPSIVRRVMGEHGVAACH